MRYSFSRRAAWLALLPLLGACTDRSPTVSGGEFFPGGSRPVTLRAFLSGAARFMELGRFSNYPPAEGQPAYLIVANQYGGVLNAHALARVTGFPSSVEFTEGGTQKRDTAFTYRRAALVLQIDSAASAATAPVTLRLWSLAQKWDPATVTWDTAIATDSTRTAWAEPGGTRADLLAEASWTPAQPGDSVLLPLDSLRINAIARDTTFNGFLITAETPGARIELSSAALRVTIHPKSATADTVNVTQTLTSGPRAFIFTPEPPRSATAWEVGGIRSARTLFRMDLAARVPGCAIGCDSVPLRNVSLNEVALVLRPVPVPEGFETLDSVPIRIRRVQEPELGRFAPLLEPINDPTAGGAVAWYRPGDTTVVVPITQFATGALRADSVSGNFALLSEPPGGRFGVVWFEPMPRLRITYTVLPRVTKP